MLHHVGIEVAPEDVARAAQLFELLGFERIEPPPTLAEFTWLEREGTQVHLMPDPDPIAPPRGHLAVVVPEFEATLAALRDAGFEVEAAREHWGAARARVLAPAGHRVELRAAPPS
ncbi:MAG TPA: VOC family protein [Solirubrobacterales bacterium]|nr:VOC family protein [Solirubrobacterales bacterium]